MSRVSATPSDLPRSLRLFFALSGLLTTVCLGVEWVCTRLHLPETYTSPFLVAIHYFDFEGYAPRFAVLHQPAFYAGDKPFLFSYPAPASLAYALFFHAGPDLATNVFLGFIAASYLAVALLFARALWRRGVARTNALACAGGTLLLSFPAWFLFQRANIEIVSFLLLAAGLWALVCAKPYTAALCLGLGASLKMLPIILLALLLPRRQYRAAVMGGVVFLLANVAGLLFLGPSLAAAYHGLAGGFAAFHQEFISGFYPSAIGFDHALPGFYRRWFGTPASFAAMLRGYTVITVLLGAALYLARIRRLPFLNQLLCLCVAMVWLPPVSFEYTLVHLYLCLGLLVLAATGQDAIADSSLTPFFVLLAILCSPLSELIYHGVRFGGQVKCVLLPALLVLSLTRCLPSRYDFNAAPA